ncbi:TRAP transporter small permease [Trichlorobacter lovleyi]|uniref:TRAP transporter small permease n=1 Tax=Trichlorobacter lovleyi TaxID=313985 RepID=UPI00223EE2F6|nr:TRAP transporter small permease [Trichlorobacter lovleyi]QOX78885.1 TRAP transporter small permease [Trichlorobacter lovleyi]
MMKYLDHLEEWIITSLIGAATIVIAVAVTRRYLMGIPIPAFQDWLLGFNMAWAQELCIYMFVWMAKFGAAYGVRTGIHVGVDVLINRLPPKWCKTSVLIGLFSGAVFTGIIATLGANFVWENGMHYSMLTRFGLPIPDDLYEGPITPDLEWPTWAVYLAIPLGSSLMCFRFLQVAWTFARTGELPHHDHSHVDGLDDETVDATEALEEYEAHKFDPKVEEGGVK